MIIDPTRLPVWPCYFGCNCTLNCHSDIPFVHEGKCYMTTEIGLRVRGDCDCEVRDNGIIAISYPTYGAEKPMLMELVNLINSHELIDFRKIHYIFTNEVPGPSESKWPLVWTGLVQIDDDKVAFEFIEKRDTDD